VEATRLIALSRPAVRIVMLTTFDDDRYVEQALRYGAVGYILKSVSPSELISSLRAVRDGAILISPGAADKLVRRDRAGGSAPPSCWPYPELERPHRGLTPRGGGDRGPHLPGGRTAGAGLLPAGGGGGAAPRAHRQVVARDDAPPAGLLRALPPGIRRKFPGMGREQMVRP
jgi:hypothetical protein